MARIAVLLLIVLCAGCYNAPPLETEIPPEILLKAAAASEAEQMPILTAVMTLLEADIFVRYTWAPPTDGGSPVKYAVETSFDVTDTTFIMLDVGQYNYIARVAGVDSLTRQGPHSNYSIPENVREWDIR